MPASPMSSSRIGANAVRLKISVRFFSALSGYMGSAYVDQFNKFGRTFQIYAQADAPFRLRLEDVMNMTVRNQDGNNIPLGTLIKITPVAGPSLISLYNLYPTASLVA